MKQQIITTKRGAMQGFTLVELMVSIAVFSIVMLISTSVLLVMINVNAKSQALYSAYSNLAFALDNMTREIRTGKNYYCTASSNDGGSLFSSNVTHDCEQGSMIVFNKGWTDERIGYRLSNGHIEQRTASSNWFPITGDEVSITSFLLTAQNTGSGNSEQPTITVSVSGNLYNGLNQATAFDISTGVTQRILDR